MSFRLILLAAVNLAVLQICGSAPAGGGPENVLLVVNSRSWASETVANHYIHVRHIPPSNVLYLDWDGGFENIDVAKFREKILGPVMSALEQRGLATQIDCVVYSSDFPWSIWLQSDLAGNSPPAELSPVASINGATYLWQRVMMRSPSVIGLDNNAYARPHRANQSERETHGFRSWYGWARDGQLLETGGEQYMLSSMLAVTSGRGMSVREAVAGLERSPLADFKAPAGTIYFCDTSDIRASTRAPGFNEAVRQLSKLGVRAQVVSTSLPDRRSDVQGLMMGAASYHWSASGSTIQPGAFCDNLTSYGGDLSEAAGQTPLTELLRYGAAASTGAVVEPFNITQKFPVPDVHVYYARGCSLAEAYYQSVSGPYQLLLVGDPLCRPWAQPPHFETAGISAGATLSGLAKLSPRLITGAPAVGRYELFVDGRREATCAQGQPLSLDTTRFSDGYHEVRIVGIGASPIETQGQQIVPVTFANHGRNITLTSSLGPAATASWGQPFKLRAQVNRGAGMEKLLGIVWTHNGRLLGKVGGERGEIDVDPRRFGLGPVQVQAVGVARGGAAQHVMSAPLELMVQPGQPLRPSVAGDMVLLRGLQLTIAGGEPVPIQQTRKPNWLSEAGVKPGNSFTLRGIFDVERRDVYQFQVAHHGGLELRVGRQLLYRGASNDAGLHYLPVALAAGRHELTVTGKAGDEVQLKLLFGGPGATSVDGERFRQPE